jgi:hypothetical protein
MADVAAKYAALLEDSGDSSDEESDAALLAPYCRSRQRQPPAARSPRLAKTPRLAPAPTSATPAAPSAVVPTVHAALVVVAPPGAADDGVRVSGAVLALSVDALKVELRRCGWTTAGNKIALQQRVQSVRDGARPPPPKEYSPRPRSGNWAVLIALAEGTDRTASGQGLPITAIKTAASPHADESFFPASADDHYTAWSGVNKYLVVPGLVSKQGNPARFSLTTTGWELADRLIRAQRAEPPE